MRIDLWRIHMLKTLLLLLTAPLWGPFLLIHGWLYERSKSPYNREHLEWAREHCPNYYRLLMENKKRKKREE